MTKNFYKLVEQIGGIIRAWSGFGVVLHTEAFFAFDA